MCPVCVILDVTLTTMTFSSNKLNEQAFGSKPIARGQVPDPKRVEEDLAAAADIPGQKCTLLLILDMPKKHLTKQYVIGISSTYFSFLKLAYTMLQEALLKYLRIVTLK